MTSARRQSARQAVGVKFQIPILASIGREFFFGAGKSGRCDEK
jgi:hypothetical protein